MTHAPVSLEFQWSMDAGQTGALEAWRALSSWRAGGPVLDPASPSFWRSAGGGEGKDVLCSPGCSPTLADLLQLQKHWSLSPLLQSMKPEVLRCTEWGLTWQGECGERPQRLSLARHWDSGDAYLLPILLPLNFFPHLFSHSWL